MNHGKMRKLFAIELQEARTLETAVLNLIPDFRDQASIPLLSKIFSTYVIQSLMHQNRLAEIFHHLNIPAASKLNSQTQTSWFAEAWMQFEQNFGSDIIDYGLLNFARKIAYAKTANYKGLVSLAEMLDDHFSADILTASLEDEEKFLDQLEGLFMTKLKASSLSSDIPFPDEISFETPEKNTIS